MSSNNGYLNTFKSGNSNDTVKNTVLPPPITYKASKKDKSVKKNKPTSGVLGEPKKTVPTPVPKNTQESERLRVLLQDLQMKNKIVKEKRAAAAATATLTDSKGLDIKTSEISKDENKNTKENTEKSLNTDDIKNKESTLDTKHDIKGLPTETNVNKFSVQTLASDPIEKPSKLKSEETKLSNNKKSNNDVAKKVVESVADIMIRARNHVSTKQIMSVSETSTTTKNIFEKLVGSIVSETPEIPSRSRPNNNKRTNKFGQRRDRPDVRDLFVEFEESSSTFSAIGASFGISKSKSLVSKMPPVEDQRELGACTAFAVEAAFEYDLINNEHSPVKQSPKTGIIRYNALTRPRCSNNKTSEKEELKLTISSPVGEVKLIDKDSKDENITGVKVPETPSSDDAILVKIDSKGITTLDSKSDLKKEEEDSKEKIKLDKEKSKTEKLKVNRTVEEDKVEKREKASLESKASKEKVMQKIKLTDASELFLYYNTRAIEGTVTEDTGASLRSTIKALNIYGICPEKLCPYTNYETDFTKKPSDAAYASAKLFRAVRYSRVKQTLSQMKACIGKGYPFVCGVDVFASFLTDKVSSTGNVPMPDVRNEEYYGGHAIVICGYNDSTKTFDFQNSWGTGWGNKGRGTLPYDYLSNPNLTSDMWVITSVTSAF